MAVDTLYADSTASNTGWANPGNAWGTPNAVGATSGAAGNVLELGLADLPGATELDATSVTFGIRARYPSGSTGRAQSLLVELMRGAVVVSSFSTGDLPKDSTYRDYTGAVGVADLRAQVADYRVRITHQEGSGMAGTMSLDVDAAWGKVTYELRQSTITGLGGIASGESVPAPVVLGGDVSLTGDPPNAYVDTAYSFTPTVSGGDGSYTYSVVGGTLPAWASLNTATGEISGTPTATGSVSVTLRADDGSGVNAPGDLVVAFSVLAFTIETGFGAFIYTGDGTGQVTIASAVDLSAGGYVVVVQRGSAAPIQSTQFFSLDGSTIYERTTAGGVDYVAADAAVVFGNGTLTLRSAAGVDVAESGKNYVVYAWRKHPLVCDILTYVGDGTTNREIAHGLGAEVGVLAVQGLSTRISNWWYGLSTSQYLNPNTTLVSSDVGDLWGAATPDSTTFRVSDTHVWGTNVSGRLHFAVLFPRDSGFVCAGSFIGDGTSPAQTQNIAPGYPLQFASIASHVFDEVRGAEGFIGNEERVYLFNGSTFTNEYIEAVPTGLAIKDSLLNSNGNIVCWMGVRVVGSSGPPPAITVPLEGIASAETFGNPLVLRASDSAVSHFFEAVSWTGDGTAGRLLPTRLDLSGGGFALFRANNIGANWTDSEDMLSDGVTHKSNSYGLGSTDFVMGNGTVQLNLASYNQAGKLYQAWLFRRWPRFLDTKQYAGSSNSGGVSQLLTHALDAVPALIMGGSSDFVHLSFANPDVSVWRNDLRASSHNNQLGGVLPTASSITVGTSTPNAIGGDWNVTGSKMLALFADNDAADGMIRCGYYVGNGSATGPVVNLGWQPQFLWVLAEPAHPSSGTADIYPWVVDLSKSAPGFAGTETLHATPLNRTESVYDSSLDVLEHVAGGFQIKTADPLCNASGVRYYYIAVRALDVVAQSFAADSISSAEAVAQPTLLLAQAAGVGSVASAEQVGAPAIVAGPVTIGLDGTAGAETFGALELLRGGVTLALSGIASAESVPAPTMQGLAVFVEPVGIPTAASVPAPVLAAAYGLALDGTPSAVVVSAPALTATATLAPDAVASAQQVPAPTLAPGGVSLAVASVPSAEQVPAPALGVGSTFVAPSSVASGAAVAAVALVPGAIQAPLDSVVSGSSVPAPAMTTGALVLALEPVAGAGTVPTPTVEPGLRPVALQSIAPSNVIPAPLLTAQAWIQLQPVADEAAVGSPSLGAATSFGVDGVPSAENVSAVTLHASRDAAVASIGDVSAVPPIVLLPGPVAVLLFGTQSAANVSPILFGGGSRLPPTIGAPRPRSGVAEGERGGGDTLVALRPRTPTIGAQ